MKTWLQRIRGVFALALLAMVGCTDPDPPAVRSGSVMNPDVSASYLELGREVLRLGTREGAGPLMFSRISGLEIDDRGQVWIADGASSELRVFDGSGNHLRSVGSAGRGPGRG